MIKPSEIEIIKTLQKGLPLVSRPFKEIGRQLDLSEEEVLEIIKSLQNRGLIRRFGATVKHQRLGYRANAMAAWKVPKDKVVDIGYLFASNDSVSHCYERETVEKWTHNLFTMIHGVSSEKCLNTLRKMSEESGIDDYLVLFSTRELKKSSMRYFE